MPQHRETSSSVAVAELLRTGADDAPIHTRHRARSRTAYRLKLAVGGAVATGALVGSATQFAHAAPILAGGHDSGTAQVAPVPAPMPVPAPFRLQNLPPEVAGPLAQALHLHLEIRDANDNKIDPEPYVASKEVVLTQQWGPAQ